MESSPAVDSFDSTSPSSGTPSNSGLENGNSPISFLRFLISNAAAGSVIGKGGATISEFQAQSGTRIQLSRNHEYFPGTTDRIIELSGTVDRILGAFSLILTKIHNENDQETKPKANQVKLVVPHVVCGAIIGKGGATIRSFIKETNANIKLSSPEDSIPGTRDRLVTVIGSLEEQLHAVTLIMKKISEDSNYLQCPFAPSIYTGKNMWGLNQQFQGPYTATPPPFTYGSTTSPYDGYPMKGIMAPYIPVHSAPLQVRVPIVPGNSPSMCIMMRVQDECIGAIVGRGGKTITDIQQMYGVHIKIYDQGDFFSGTPERTIAIIGSLESIYAAQHMIQQKISQSSLVDHTK